MAQENVGVVRRAMWAFENDADAFAAITHPEVEWFPYEDNHTPSYGIEGAMRIRNQWLDAWDEVRADLEEVVEGGESVVASIHIMGRGKTSGAEVDVRLHMHFKVREDKIVYLYEYEDRAAALEAAGLSE
jgi:ketosteroid isomerase-like protein